MSHKKARRKDHSVIIQVLIVLVLPMGCFTKQATNRSVKNVPSATAAFELSVNDDGEAEAVDLGDDVIGSVRSGPPSNWADFSQAEKIQYWNDEAKKENDQTVQIIKDDLIPAARTAGVDSVKIEGLNNYANELKTAGDKIATGEHNNEFKELYVMDNNVAKLKDRSTPMSQQHAERSLAVSQAIGTGVKKIKDNWGKRGREWEVVGDLSTMLSGVLAVIPTPYTKFLAVFLDSVSSLIGIFSSTPTENPVEQWITNAVQEIKDQFTQVNWVNSKANIAQLDFTWKVVTQVIKEQMTTQDWDTYQISDSFPDPDAKIVAMVTASTWVEENLENGEGAENTMRLMLNYYRMCKLVDQVWGRIISLMPFDPTGEDVAHNNIREMYSLGKNEMRRATFIWTKENVFVINRNSAITLRYFYPPGITQQSSEVFDYIETLSYLQGDIKNGRVIGMSGIPEAPKGRVTLESAAWPGWFISLASDWSGYVEHVSWKIKYCGLLDGCLHKYTLRTDTFDLGVMITLRQGNTNTMINIESPINNPDTRTLTFEEQSGQIKYLSSFIPNLTVPNNEPGFTKWVEAAAPHRQGDVPIFAPTSSKPTTRDRGITTSGSWRIIPLVEENGNGKTPVMIGDADGDSWLEAHDSYISGNQSPIYLKPLTPEQDGDKFKVPDKNIFYMTKH